MNASTFFKSTTLVLALMGTMTCCANQSKKNAETEATTDKFESADWQLYNLRGKVKSCTESKVMAELVGTDQLKATDEEPMVQEMKFDESGWLLSNNYYRRSTTSRKAAEYGYNPNDAEVVVKVKRCDMPCGKIRRHVSGLATRGATSVQNSFIYIGGLQPQFRVTAFKVDLIRFSVILRHAVVPIPVVVIGHTQTHIVAA